MVNFGTYLKDLLFFCCICRKKKHRKERERERENKQVKKKDYGEITLAFPLKSSEKDARSSSDKKK